MIVPINVSVNTGTNTFYIASMIDNSEYANKPYKYIDGVRRKSTFSFTPSSTAFSVPFPSGFSTGTYGIKPDVCGAECIVGGEITSSTTISAGHTGVTVNSNTGTT